MSIRHEYNQYDEKYWGRYDRHEKKYVAVQGINELPCLAISPMKEIKAFAQKCNPQRSYIELPPVEMDLLCSIICPRGCRLGENINEYKLIMCIDECHLRIIQEKICADAEVCLENECGKYKPFDMGVKVYKVSLVGKLYYHLRITGFECKIYICEEQCENPCEEQYEVQYDCPCEEEYEMQCQPSCKGNKVTLNEKGFIPINVTLGYTTNKIEPALDGYVLTVDQEEEYVITEEGEQIGREDSRFFEILQSGNQRLTYQVPYALAVGVCPPPIC